MFSKNWINELVYLYTFCVYNKLHPLIRRGGGLAYNKIYASPPLFGRGEIGIMHYVEKKCTCIIILGYILCSINEEQQNEDLVYAFYGVLF